jgi:Na+/melibiose symporter-like transporter
MCLPTKTDQSTSSATGTRSMLGMGALMLLACLAGPALVGAIGGLGIGVLLGAGGAVAALALCAAVPAVAVALRRRSARRQPAADALGVRRGA